MIAAQRGSWLRKEHRRRMGVRLLGRLALASLVATLWLLAGLNGPAVGAAPSTPFEQARASSLSGVAQLDVSAAHAVTTSRARARSLDTRVYDLSSSVSRTRTSPAAPVLATDGRIYVIRGADETYVGQSRNIASRLAQHVASGRFTQAEADAAEQIAVAGGKTAREVAEQQKIDELGGIGNVRNPIGQARLNLMGDGYTRP